MKGHPFRIRLPRKLVSSVQFRFAVTFTVLVAILLTLINTYPTRASRDIVFAEKQSALTNRAAVVSSSLSLLDNLTPDNTRQVLALLDLRDLTRIVVTDSTGLAVYDSAAENNIRGKYTLYPELVRALDGQAVFYSHYTNEAFLSRAAMPVMSSGKTVGAVYVCESDSERAALIGSIQRRLATITIGIGAAALVVLWFSIKMLTRRITQLADGVRTVQRGDYSFRLTLAGDDELTELGREFNNLTERLETTEAQRRRFVSDASHELKTPLQGIIGSAELIENGMVKPDDLPRFVGHIHTEAARLVTLIDDIIRLSQLDEGGELPTEPVDLLTVSQEAAQTLQDAAAARQVTVSVQGEPAVIPGVRRLLYEIVYNLCDNAIKYNRDGGRVDITVVHDADGSSVTVADTGIGIAPEHQARVFERFYRVDKSHSKASGGTGLGLSIVKHAMQLHHGRIELESTPGTGTTIRAIFPKA